jgi:hypothetical protein
VFILPSLNVQCRVRVSRIAAVSLLELACACSEAHSVPRDSSASSEEPCSETGCGRAERRTSGLPHASASATPSSGRAADVSTDAAGSAAPPPPKLDELLAALPQGEPGEVVAMPSDDSAAFFNDTQVHELDLTVTPEDLALIDSDPSVEMMSTRTSKWTVSRSARSGSATRAAPGPFSPRALRQPCPAKCAARSWANAHLRSTIDHSRQTRGQWPGH